MTEPSVEAQHIEKLYEFGERLNEVEDKSQVFFFSFFKIFQYCGVDFDLGFCFSM